MKVYIGDVVSVNSSDEVFRYLVEDVGRICYVGDVLPEKYASAGRVDLDGRALLPAFVDTHQHFASFSIFNAGLNVMDAVSNFEIAEQLRAFAETSTAKSIIAFDASPHSVKERRLITLAEIDAVCPDREVMVFKYDGHACIINGKLLSRLDSKLCKLRGYHPDTGEMNQEAFFACSDYITGSLSIPELFRNKQKATDFMASRGIGCVHTVSSVGFILNLDITMEKLFAKSLRNGFQLRVFHQSMDTSVPPRAGFRGSEAASSAHLTVASAPMMRRSMNRTATRKGGVGECFTIRMRR